MKSLRTAFLFAVLVLSSSAALADVTIKMTIATAGGPVAMDMTSVSFIKGLRMRNDVKVMDQDMSMFVDVPAKRQVLFNNVTNQVQDIDAMMAMMSMAFGEIKTSVKPNQQTKNVLGYACSGHLVEMTMPMTIMNETITMSMSGTVWIAKDAPGAEEYYAFNKAAAAAGLMTSLFAQGPQANGFSRIMAIFAELGMPLEQHFQTTMSGTGQMAEMMAQMGAGNIDMTMQVTSISVDPISAGTFTFPGSTTKK